MVSFLGAMPPLLCLPDFDPSSPHFVSAGLGGCRGATAPTASAGLTGHVVALMTDLVKVQCDACADAIAACATAVAPKTDSECFCEGPQHSSVPFSHWSSFGG